MNAIQRKGVYALIAVLAIVVLFPPIRDHTAYDATDPATFENIRSYDDFYSHGFILTADGQPHRQDEDPSTPYSPNTRYSPAIVSHTKTLDAPALGIDFGLTLVFGALIILTLGGSRAGKIN